MGILPHRGFVVQIEFSAAANALIARGADNTIRVWDLETLRPVRYVVEDTTFLGLLGSRAGEKRESGIVLARRGGGLRLWIPRPRRRGRIPVREVYLWQMAGVRFGRVTAAAASDSVVLVGNERGGLFRLKGLASLVGSVHVPPAPESFRAHRGAISSISLVSEAGLYVTAGADGRVRTWKLGRRKPEWEIPGRIAALSADGGFLAVGDGKGVAVYHAASGIALSWNPLPSRAGRIASLRFNGDGTAIAGILAGQVVIWK